MIPTIYTFTNKEKLEITNNSSKLWIFTISNSQKIICEIFKDLSKFNNIIVVFNTIDPHSWTISSKGFSSLEAYKQYLFLKKELKSVSSNIIAEFSELDDIDKLSVINGTLKITWMWPKSLQQFQQYKNMIISINEDDYNTVTKVLSLVSKDTQKIKEFLITHPNIASSPSSLIVSTFLNF